jgi:hypothetical protein
MQAYKKAAAVKCAQTALERRRLAGQCLIVHSVLGEQVRDTG